MTRMNYDLQAKRDRVRKGLLLPKPLSLNGPPARPIAFKWMGFPHGPHKGKTWPQLLFSEYKFFRRAADFNLYGELARQYHLVRDRSAHILPDRDCPELFEFAHILEADGTYKRFVIVAIDVRAPKYINGDHCVLRTPNLDMRIALSAENRRMSWAAMTRAVRREFFSKLSHEMSPEDIFFADANNFA